MKSIISSIGIVTLACFAFSFFTLKAVAQEDTKNKKTERHIKMVKVDEDGNKVELDTIIEGDNIFVWEGDTIGGKELKWVSEDDFDFDFTTEMDIDVEETGDGKVIVMKSGKSGAPVIREFKVEGDSSKTFRMKVIKEGEAGEHDVMIWNGKDDNEMIFHAPQVPQIMRIEKQTSGNVIDLSDPGIISYDKKELRDGREKITIIRNKPDEGAQEISEEIILNSAAPSPVVIHKAHPEKSKSVKVIKDDDGNVTIYEDDKVMKFKEGEDGGKFITKEGDVFHIKEIKEGDQKKVEVKVEVEEKKEKEEK